CRTGLYTPCQSHCQPNCHDKSPKCTRICLPGCICPIGTIRAQNCGPNGQFSECSAHCQPNCNDNNPICTRNCVPGCICGPGLIRYSSTNGRCIKPSQWCVNGRYSSCSTACPTTCQNLRRPPEVCAAVCVAGCVCNRGYVRRTSNSNPRPKLPYPNVQPTTPYGLYNGVCGPCSPGCVCAPGLIRYSDAIDKCVAPEECGCWG
ncbi:unnamed protein product, partial [Medioppia subpectinata]